MVGEGEGKGTASRGTGAATLAAGPVLSCGCGADRRRCSQAPGTWGVLGAPLLVEVALDEVRTTTCKDSTPTDASWLAPRRWLDG